MKTSKIGRKNRARTAELLSVSARRQKASVAAEGFVRPSTSNLVLNAGKYIESKLRFFDDIFFSWITLCYKFL